MADDEALEDIENLCEDTDGVSVSRLEHAYIQPKPRVTRIKRSEGEKKMPVLLPTTDSSVLDDRASSNIPYTAKIWVKTWGCSHNNSDGEYMAGQLITSGYSLSDNPDDADLWLLNSCTVKGPSETTFWNSVAECQKKNRRVVVAGCVPQGQHKDKKLEKLSIVGVQQIDRVVEVVEETMKGHTVQLLGSVKGGGASLELPKIRKNPYVEIIAINTGCLNQCTYCKTKHARGELRSYPLHEIVNRVVKSVQEGVVEIWLTSEDLGTYGRDIGCSLPELLWKIVGVLPPGVMLRCGMTNPPYMLEHVEEIAKIMQHPNVYAFLHVPVQAGSDRVLEDMKRKYTIADFEKLADYLIEHVPGMLIATDLICGFPSEADEDFECTLDLVKKYKFPILHINQFYPRPGTPAARMKRLNTKIVKDRSREATLLFNSYETRQGKVGNIESVLVTDISTDGRFYVAHNKSYDQVLLQKIEGVMGKQVEVTITEAGKHYLMGELIKESLRNAPKRPMPKQLQKLSGGLSMAQLHATGKVVSDVMATKGDVGAHTLDEDYGGMSSGDITIYKRDNSTMMIMDRAGACTEAGNDINTEENTSDCRTADCCNGEDHVVTSVDCCTASSSSSCSFSSSLSSSSSSSSPTSSHMSTVFQIKQEKAGEAPDQSREGWPESVVRERTLELSPKKSVSFSSVVQTSDGDVVELGKAVQSLFKESPSPHLSIFMQKLTILAAIAVLVIALTYRVLQ